MVTISARLVRASGHDHTRPWIAPPRAANGPPDNGAPHPVHPMLANQQAGPARPRHAPPRPSSHPLGPPSIRAAPADQSAYKQEQCSERRGVVLVRLLPESNRPQSSLSAAAAGSSGQPAIEPERMEYPDSAGPAVSLATCPSAWQVGSSATALCS